jgi:hypothetical protein
MGYPAAAALLIGPVAERRVAHRAHTPHRMRLGLPPRPPPGRCTQASPHAGLPATATMRLTQRSRPATWSVAGCWSWAIWPSGDAPSGGDSRRTPTPAANPDHRLAQLHVAARSMGPIASRLPSGLQGSAESVCVIPSDVQQSGVRRIPVSGSVRDRSAGQLLDSSYEIATSPTAPISRSNHGWSRDTVRHATWRQLVGEKAGSAGSAALLGAQSRRRSCVTRPLR